MSKSLRSRGLLSFGLVGIVDVPLLTVGIVANSFPCVCRCRMGLLHSPPLRVLRIDSDNDIEPALAAPVAIGCRCGVGASDFPWSVRNVRRGCGSCCCWESPGRSGVSMEGCCMRSMSKRSIRIPCSASRSRRSGKLFVIWARAASVSVSMRATITPSCTLTCRRSEPSSGGLSRRRTSPSRC